MAHSIDPPGHPDWHLPFTAVGSSGAGPAGLTSSSPTPWLGWPELGFYKTEACMSNSPLASELHQLRLEFAQLAARVLALEEAAFNNRASGATVQGSPVTVNYLGTGQYPEVPPFPDRLQQSPVWRSEVTSSAGGSPGAVGSPGLTEAERRRIAEEAGAFLRRSLDGDHRGGSGRSRLPLPSSVYILARDISGVLYNPVKVFRDFSVLRPFVKRQGACHDSVFIGFPTVWEAKVCARAAQLSWPDE